MGGDCSHKRSSWGIAIDAPKLDVLRETNVKAPSFDHVVSLAKLSIDDASAALAQRETFLALLTRISEIVVVTDRVDRLLFVLSMLAEEDAPWLERGLTVSFQHAGEGVSLMTVVTPPAPNTVSDGDPTFFLSLPVEEFAIVIMSNPDSIGAVRARFDGADVFLEVAARPKKVTVATGPVTHETRRMPSIVVPPAARPTPVPSGNSGGDSGPS